MSIITLDMETYYSKTYSLSKMTTEEYINGPEFEAIGFSYQIDGGEPVWHTGDHDHLSQVLHSLDLPSHKLIAHNAMFDAAILAFRFGIHPKFIIDTMGMARPIQSITGGNSLAKLVEHFQLGRKGTEVLDALGKHRSDFTPAELARYGEYCKNDTAITYKLYHALLPYSTPQEMYVIDMMLRLYTDPVLLLNVPMLNRHLLELQGRKERLLSKVEAVVGKDGLMSNLQFAELLTRLGVTPPTKISKTTNKEAFAFAKTDPGLKELLEHPDERVQAVVCARLGVKSTLEETRTQRFLSVAARGCLPISINYYGAHTGRGSGAEALNLQNLPRGGALRMAVRAPEGHAIIACDSAQIEARVVAWLAGQEDLVESFRLGRDIYSEFATTVYGYSVSKETKTERYVGKTAVLGLGFEMGHVRFKEQLKASTPSVDMPLDEAKRIVDLYRTKYNKIKALWKAAGAAMRAVVAGHAGEFGVGIKLFWDHEGIHMPNGMILRYPNLRFDPELEQYVYDSRYGKTTLYSGKIVENIVQALARTIVFYQTCKIDQKLRKIDRPGARFKLVLSVHDEAVVISPQQASKQVEAMMMKIMSQPPAWAADLPIACESSMGENYADCK